MQLYRLQSKNNSRDPFDLWLEDFCLLNLPRKLINIIKPDRHHQTMASPPTITLSWSHLGTGILAE